MPGCRHCRISFHAISEGQQSVSSCQEWIERSLEGKHAEAAKSRSGTPNAFDRQRPNAFEVPAGHTWTIMQLGRAESRTLSSIFYLISFWMRQTFF